MAAAASAAPPPRRNSSARTPPTRMLPKSAQKMKNLVLSQTHGWRTTRFGTMNQSHIGANQVVSFDGNQRGRKNAAISSGRNRERFQTQNHTKSGRNMATPF